MNILYEPNSYISVGATLKYMWKLLINLKYVEEDLPHKH